MRYERLLGGKQEEIKRRANGDERDQPVQEILLDASRLNRA